MHKLSTIISKPVFSLFEGVWVGTVLDICLNNGKIGGFFVLSSDEENALFIKGKDISTIGEDIIVIKNVEKLSFVSCETLNLMNKSAITFSGLNLGTINEVFFDDKLNMISIQTDFGVLLPSEKIANVGEDVVIFSLGEKVKISSFKPRSKKKFSGAENLTVSILEENSNGVEFSVIEDKNTLINNRLYIPKKIMQNPNFLIGRTVSNFIKNENGEVIIGAGEIITEKTISKAKIYNKFFELFSFAN